MRTLLHGDYENRGIGKSPERGRSAASADSANDLAGSRKDHPAGFVRGFPFADHGGRYARGGAEGLDPLRVLAIMPFLIPPTFPYTLPCSLLFACTVVYGGMSGRNEITAIKAAGIHLRHVVLPSVIFSLVLAAVGVYIADQFIPACSRKVTEIVLSDIQSMLYGLLRTRNAIDDPKLPYRIYVVTVRDETLIKPTIFRRNPSGGRELIIQAEEAVLRVVPDPQNPGDAVIHIRLINAKVTNPTSNDTASWRDWTEVVPLPGIAKPAELKIENLTFQGCFDRSLEQKDAALEEYFRLACGAAISTLNGDPTAAALTVEKHTEEAIRRERKSRESIGEVHVRAAQALAVIPFVLLGCPVSILFQRREFLQTFFFCFLPIITVYYPVMILVFNVFKERPDGTILMLWAPTVAITVLALPVLRRVLQH